MTLTALWLVLDRFWPPSLEAPDNTLRLGMLVLVYQNRGEDAC